MKFHRKAKVGPVSIDYQEKNASNVTLTCIGVDMPCPLCDEVVMSGYTHECEKNGGITVRRTRKIDLPEGQWGKSKSKKNQN